MVALRKSVQQQPEIHIFARTEMESGSTVYRTNGSASWHTVTLNLNGTTGCLDEQDNECMAHHFHGTCRHVKAAQKYEAALETMQNHIDDAEYQRWLKDTGRDQPMTREQYVGEFNPDGIL